MADTEDHESAEDVEVMFAPSYQLEWLLGSNVQIIFTPEGRDE